MTESIQTDQQREPPKHQRGRSQQTVAAHNKGLQSDLFWCLLLHTYCRFMTPKSTNIGQYLDLNVGDLWDLTAYSDWSVYEMLGAKDRRTLAV